MADQQFTREVAKRVFIQELRDSDLDYKKTTGDMAPSYVLTPTGAECNRVLVVGVLTEKEEGVGKNGDEYWRLQISDATGNISVFVGKYQPEAMAAAVGLNDPAIVFVVGKPRLYHSEEGKTYVSINIESITEVTNVHQDIWTIETAKATLARIDNIMSDSRSPAAQKAVDRYSPNLTVYHEMVENALRSLTPPLAAAEQHEEGAIFQV